jgi:hypothetical protein
MYRLLFLIANVLFTAGISVAQNGYERVAGGDLPEWFRHVLPTGDGGCVSVGATRSFGFGDAYNTDGYVVKWNPDGDTLWTRTFGTAGNEEAVSSVENEFGYLVAGFNTSVTNGLDMYAVQYDSDGNVLWENFYGGIYSETAQAAAASSNGQVALAGYSTTYTNGGSDLYIVKIDAGGVQTDSAFFGGGASETALGMTATADGGFVCIGLSNSTDPNYNIYAVKVDSNLDLLWAKNFGGVLEDLGFDVAEDASGDLWLLGYQTGSPDTSYMVLIHTDANGENAVTLHPGTKGGDLGNSIRPAPDGGFIIAGVSSIIGKGSQMLLEKLNASGDTLWSRRFGGTQNEYGYGAGVDSDGNLYLAGETEGFGVTAFDGYVVKIAADGTVPCPSTVSFASGDHEICEDQAVFFTNTTVSSNEFLWTANGGIFSEEFDAGYYFSDAGIYEISLSACQASTTQDILVHAKPPTYFTYSIAGNTVQFTLDPSAAANLQSVMWNFGDGSPVDSFSLNPSHSYAVSFDYWVVVTVIDSFGCDSTYAGQLDLPTGMEEVPSAEFGVYPNPAHDMLTIKAGAGIELLVIYGSDRRVILKCERQAEPMQISVSDFPAGIYLIRAEFSGGLAAWSKLVIQAP